MGTRFRPVHFLMLVTVGGGCVPTTPREGVPFTEEPPFAPPDLGVGAPPLFPPVSFGPTVTQEVAPPPLSGGTLLVMRDGRTAVAADPDRDRVWIVDIVERSLRGEIALSVGDEPGRVVEDAAGRVHVALRSGHAIADIDPAAFQLLARRSVCPAPRGLAYDAAADALHVACAGGELVTLPAAGGEPTRTLHLDRDLRDVVVEGGALWVSRFRTAELLRIDGAGAVSARRAPPTFRSKGIRMGAPFEPDVAWRTIALPSGGVAVLHQRVIAGDVSTGSGGYGAAGDLCDSGVVHATVTLLEDGAAPVPSPLLPSAVLALDLALSPSGTQVAIVAAGNTRADHFPRLYLTDLDEFRHDASDRCVPVGDGLDQVANPVAQPSGQPIAVAFDPNGMIVVQSREPPSLELIQGPGCVLPAGLILLPGASREDTGHAIFHANAGGLLACASCHPEGGDDGRVWHLTVPVEDGQISVGPRRTQSVRGGILQTMPLHWEGDQPDLGHLLDDVFVRRMQGPSLAGDQVGALGHWIDRVPLLSAVPPADPAAAERGRALFDDLAGPGCAGCHGGATLTNNATIDVGTGGSFQVPSLRGVAFRAPFLHDGCAPTLRDRFGPCGGSQHGRTASLTSVEIDDLVAYLETL